MDEGRNPSAVILEPHIGIILTCTRIKEKQRAQQVDYAVAGAIFCVNLFGRWEKFDVPKQS